MASTAFTIVKPALAGTTVTAKTGVTSGQTITFSASTAAGAIDFRTAIIRIQETSGSGVNTLSIGAGDEFNSVGIGAASVSVTSSDTIIIGGQGFEGSRFLNSSGSVVITVTGAGTISWEAYQQPRSLE